MGDCAEIKLKQFVLDKEGTPTGWINGEFIQFIDEEIDYNNVKYETIANKFVYEKEEDEAPVTILNQQLIKTIYRLLTLIQQYSVSNPTERYKILCVSQMLASLIGYENDAAYISFLAEYLENLVRFARNEYDDITLQALHAST